MSVYHHYLDTATHLIEGYKADLPFHLYLKQFFASRKKYGSRDRKQVASLCYNFFRWGHAMQSLTIMERIINASFLISTEQSGFLQAVDPLLSQKSSLGLAEKISNLTSPVETGDIFPYPYLLSGKLNFDCYCKSMLTQPDVFLRIRPGYEKKVKGTLPALNWQHVDEGNNAIRIESGLPVEKNFHLNKELVVQDLNSQQIGTIVKTVFAEHNFKPKQVWDCCAASGGKSIMLHDIFEGINLTVSDIRQSILKNLDARFKAAGIKPRQQFGADLTIQDVKLPIRPFEFILADVPCSGSGTWARTPEQLYYFKEAIIDEYATKQKAIVLHAINYLKQGGWFVYVTCSVFKKENEFMVDLLSQSAGIKLIYTELLDGTQQKSDSMFIAIFQRNN